MGKAKYHENFYGETKKKSCEKWEKLKYFMKTDEIEKNGIKYKEELHEKSFYRAGT